MADGSISHPYAVPTMTEIAEIVPNGLVVASTFAGAGGSSTGWQIAGYRVAWACEFYPPAANSYAANHPETILDRRDIRQVTGAEILNAVGSIDVLDGSPPCQDFSMAGKRSSGWGEVRKHGDGTHQRSDDLFAEYTRILGELRPRAFVAENVAGLVTGVAKGKFKRIYAALTEQGYRVRAKVLDAQWLGVPQHRERVIIIGIRNDLGVDPTFPEPFPYRYSMLDACPWLDVFDSVRGGCGFSDDTKPLTKPVQTICAKPEGHGRWELRHNHAVGEKRRLTIAEVKRLCSFPDDYVLTGSYADQWQRLGNSVPPLMMAAVARTLMPILTVV